MAVSKPNPRCIVIAGPNGAGKTTFAREYLPHVARVMHFVNADLIAGGLSPLKPELAAIAAARVVLREIDRLASDRTNFAFETTLSGLKVFIGRYRNLGPCMTIQETHRYFWSGRYEIHHTQKKTRKLRGRSG